MSWLLYTLLHNHTQNDAVQVKEDLKVNDCIIHIEYTLGPPPGPPSCQSSLCTVEVINCSAQSWTQVPEKQANRRKHEAFTHTHTHTQGTVVVCGGQSINTGSSWHWLNLSCNSSIATFLSTAMLIQLRINILSSVSTMNKSNLLPAIWTKLLSHLYKDQKVRYSILVPWEVKCLLHVCKPDADCLWI